MITFEQLKQLETNYLHEQIGEKGQYACQVWFTIIEANYPASRVVICLSARFDNDLYNMFSIAHHPTAKVLDLTQPTLTIESLVDQLNEEAKRWHEQHTEMIDAIIQDFSKKTQAGIVDYGWMTVKVNYV